jgi:hypothetical protein
MLGWFQIDSNLVPSWFRVDFNSIPSWYQIDSMLISIWFQVDSKLIPSWFQLNSKLISTWFHIDSNLIPSWIFEWLELTIKFMERIVQEINFIQSTFLKKFVDFDKFHRQICDRHFLYLTKLEALSRLWPYTAVHDNIRWYTTIV